MKVLLIRFDSPYPLYSFQFKKKCGLPLPRRGAKLGTGLIGNNKQPTPEVRVVCISDSSAEITFQSCIMLGFNVSVFILYTNCAVKLLLFPELTKFFARKMQIFLILRNLTKQKLAMRARECRNFFAKKMHFYLIFLKECSLATGFCCNFVPRFALCVGRDFFINYKTNRT